MCCCLPRASCQRAACPLWPHHCHTIAWPACTSCATGAVAAAAGGHSTCLRLQCLSHPSLQCAFGAVWNTRARTLDPAGIHCCLSAATTCCNQPTCPNLTPHSHLKTKLLNQPTCRNPNPHYPLTLPRQHPPSCPNLWHPVPWLAAHSAAFVRPFVIVPAHLFSSAPPPPPVRTHLCICFVSAEPPASHSQTLHPAHLLPKPARAPGPQPQTLNHDP